MSPFQLPVFQLPPNTAFLPGVLYRVALTPERAASLLLPFPDLSQVDTQQVISSLSGLPLVPFTPETLQGIDAAGSALRSVGALVLCLPQTKVGSVARITNVRFDTESNNNVVVSFHALTRGSVQTSDNLEISQKVVHIFREHPSKTEKASAIVTRFNKLYSDIQEFIAKYDGESLLLLSPLATSLHIQFSSSEFQQALNRLQGMYTKDANIPVLMDITAAVMPIPFAAKCEILALTDPLARIRYVLSNVIDYYIEFFSTMNKAIAYVEEFMGLATEVQRAKFVTGQLRSLRGLLATIGKDQKDGLKAPQLTKAPPRGVLRKSASLSPPEDDELKLIADFITRLPLISSISDDTKRVLEADFRKLQRTPPQQSEWHVLRSFFDIVIDMPWDITSYEIGGARLLDLDLHEVKQQLDRDSYGLETVKRRLVQYLAVVRLHAQNDESTSAGGKNPPALSKSVTRAKPVRAPILLLGGPPGVGKTSLAKSLATALNRPFQRISLGGIRDESEIRGHRRTYVGAMPGAIVLALRRARCMDPVILLDEIDKVVGGPNAAGKVQGDPAAALLEVLDPEQNSSFVDHYLGFPVDLSQVVFICTANEPHELSRPLFDRMEFINLPAYDYEEKVVIARDFLLPRQIERNGLGTKAVVMDDEVLKKITMDYTTEAGVRNLERTIGAICRAKTVELSEREDYSPTVSLGDLTKYIGLPTHPSELQRRRFVSPQAREYGVVNGLSYNSNGSGGVLVFEAIGLPAKSRSLHMTGRLGEVLTESANIAMTFVRSILHRNLLGMDAPKMENILSQFDATEIHLHVPEGGISKDGPSAGITMTLAFLSLAIRKAVPTDIAMTGEITLRGQVLPIGGVREKLLGAHMAGMKRVLLPRINRRDVIKEYCELALNQEGDSNKFGVFGDGSLLRELIQAEEMSGSVIYGKPEAWIKDRLGLDICYVEEFWDVVRAVWGGEFVGNSHRDESRL
ncbi:hypothetical protein BABINDRAFT_34071 [Babjeviella inositovora NRRL Y-12698]|uniref:Lon protease homolog n=1 Tax=Babjeviella inositovora NRRL Y-12698 TaxID=984486 RepID=A0A1E3QW70_9ASCO|nr:uncharacterized protein BABINDRAFT_34071 [Babjeviella inositovora NRRL Y-12698]ODQ81227.1 hypothetical protein BABINDRAFT_34071 [Babjeviella inositovora NRRL Y-12698]